jgi:hypothetical protein
MLDRDLEMMMYAQTHFRPQQVCDRFSCGKAGSERGSAVDYWRTNAQNGSISFHTYNCRLVGHEDEQSVDHF